MSDSSSIPSDIVSVFDEANQQWWLYYLAGGQVKIFKGPKANANEDSANSSQYEQAFIDKFPTDLEPPSPNNSQLGVLEYIDANKVSQVSVLIHISNRTYSL